MSDATHQHGWTDELPRPRCPGCGYELAGLRDPVCPECSRVMTAEDIRHDARRRVFLELTRWQVWRRAAAVLLVGVVFGAGVAALPMVLAFGSVLAMPGLGSRSLIERLRRRIWLLSVVWICAPWAVVSLARPVLDFVYWNTTWLDAVSYDEPTFIMAVVTVTAALCVPVWRASIRRLSDVAGLGESARPVRAVSWPGRIAMAGLVLPILFYWMLALAVLSVDAGWT